MNLTQFEALLSDSQSMGQISVEMVVRAAVTPQQARAGVLDGPFGLRMHILSYADRRASVRIYCRAGLNAIALCRASAPQPEPTREKKPTIQATVFAAIEAGALNTKALVEATGLKQSQVMAALQNLKDIGKIRRQQRRPIEIVRGDEP